jgi:hypothetical protein
MTSSTFTQQSAPEGQFYAAHGRVTQEQMDHYIAEARRMRAEMFGQLVRSAYTRLFHAGKAQPAKTAHGTHPGAAHAA